MPNHPNRSPNGHPSRNPTPDEVQAAREAAGIDQLEAARLVHVSVRAWIGWEAGEQRMHPAFFHLFRLRTGQLDATDMATAEQEPID